MTKENQLLKALDILDKVQKKYDIPFDKDNKYYTITQHGIEYFSENKIHLSKEDRKNTEDYILSLHIPNLQTNIDNFFGDDIFDEHHTIKDLSDNNLMSYLMGIFKTITFTQNKNLVSAKYGIAIWNTGFHDLAKQCRGKIVDTNTRTIVSYPFDKFFNINEVPETNENIVRDRMEHSSYIYATEKKDGSTIIVSNYKNKPLITTNGSFDNDQTKLAKEIFNEKYPKFLPNVDKGYTFIFELIHPDNKIVIDYGDEKALYLLAVRDLNTEKLLSLDKTHDFANKYGFPYPKVYDFENLDVMVNLAHTLKNANQEGWVLRIGNKDGEFMAKLKLDEYFEMHKTFGKVSTKWVYRHIVNNDLDDFLALCDEDRKKDVFAEIDKINAVKEMVREKVINEAKYYLGKYGVKNFAEIEQDKQKMIQMIQEILNSRTPTCAMCVSYLRDSSKIDTSLERLTIKAFRGFLQEYEEKENNKEIEK